MKRSSVVIVASSMLLLAIAIVRLAVPDRSRLRALSVEAINISTEDVAAHSGVERTATWTPPDDVYIVGWGPRVHARGSSATLMLYLKDRKIMLFEYIEDGRTSRNEYAAPGTGFLVAKNETVTLRFRVNLGDTPGPSGGATALIYFVPVAGN